MRISDETLNAAFDKFGGAGFNDESIRALVSFVVEKSIDYEAAVTALIELGPTWYSDRGVAIGIVKAALGIEGGDDEG